MKDESELFEETWKWFNAALFNIGEMARVKQIETYRGRKIATDSNGRKQFEHLPGYYGLIITLTHPIIDRMRLSHLLDQNVNARATISGNSITLSRRVENIPYTAPQPRYR